MNETAIPQTASVPLEDWLIPSLDEHFDDNDQLRGLSKRLFGALAADGWPYEVFGTATILGERLRGDRFISINFDNKRVIKLTPSQAEALVLYIEAKRELGLPEPAPEP